MTCCPTPSPRCARSQPIRIQHHPETGQWWIVTQYGELSSSGIGEVLQRHRAHPDDEAWVNALLDRDRGRGQS